MAASSHGLAFPAVTVCNLNAMNKTFVEQYNLSDVVNILYGVDDDGACPIEVGPRNPSGGDLLDVILGGTLSLDAMLVGCYFPMENCTSESAALVYTQLGGCYTFNGDGLWKAAGIGSLYGLSMLIDVVPDESTGSFNGDEGIKIAIHPPTEPPSPNNLGIAVPPGSHAYIGLKQSVISDKSYKRSCIDSEYYTVPACNKECIERALGYECGCTLEYPIELPVCTIEDSCCVADAYVSAVDRGCECPSSCNYTSYSTSVSYSSFPATSTIEMLTQRYDINESQLKDVATVSIYYEDLNVQYISTSDAYSFTALLSDIGGNLGLFVGVSVISITEFVVWVLDELKDRCCGLSEKRLLAGICKRRSSSSSDSCDFHKSEDKPVNVRERNVELTITVNESQGAKNVEFSRGSSPKFKRDNSSGDSKDTQCSV